MIRYVFRAPLTIKGAKNADPQVIGEALTAIMNDSGGTLRPETVVNTAAAPTHALHPHFEWDDAEAAHAYRLDQARSLIRSIRVETEDHEERPAFLSVSMDGVSYRSLENVMGSRDLQRAVMIAAERDLHAWEKRFAELISICEIVRTARERLAGEIEAARPSA